MLHDIHYIYYIVQEDWELQKMKSILNSAELHIQYGPAIRIEVGLLYRIQCYSIEDKILVKILLKDFKEA